MGSQHLHPFFHHHIHKYAPNHLLIEHSVQVIWDKDTTYTTKYSEATYNWFDLLEFLIWWDESQLRFW